MKTISLNEDLAEFHEYFESIISSNLSLMVWQVDPKSQKRSIFNSSLSALEKDAGSLMLNTIDDSAYQFLEHALYFYCEESKSIFKAEQISIQNNSPNLNNSLYNIAQNIFPYLLIYYLLFQYFAPFQMYIQTYMPT